MTLPMAEVNSDLNIFGNSSYRTKKRRGHCEKQHPRRGERFLRLCGGEYSLCNNRKHRAYRNRIYAENGKFLLFNRRKLWYTFPIIL